MPSPSSAPSITAIVAATKNNGIGLNGGLPWRLPGEMKYFAKGQQLYVYLELASFRCGTYRQLSAAHSHIWVGLSEKPALGMSTALSALMRLANAATTSR
jgi:hypothetical protein